MIRLFNVKYKEDKNLSKALQCSTPLGKAITDVSCSGTILSKIPPKKGGEVTEHSSLYIWDLKDFHIELLKVRFTPSMPPHMKVDECTAFLWRFKCLSEKASFQLNCRLISSVEGSPDSGECLIAQTWENKNFNAAIGTEDDEALLSRSQYQQGLPPRFAAENLINFNLIEYLKDGISVSLPPFLKNEEGQIQFIVSWMKLSGRYPCSTWFAVDAPAKEILQTIGLSFP